jgi:serine/alanine adding enzyme
VSDYKFLRGKEIDKQQWDDLLINNKFGSPFQSAEYFKIFNSIPGLRAEVFAVSNKDKLEALCVATIQKEKGIKGYFSRRAIIYGGPLFLEEATNSYTFLIDNMAVILGQLVIYSEVRNYADLHILKEPFQKKGWVFEPHLNFHFDCSNKVQIWEKFNTNRKRQIKKALSSGVSIKVAEHESEIKDFYTILKVLYKEKIKKPLMPFAFFSQFFNSPNCKFLLVMFEGKIIGGIMCPILPNRAIYEWFICGLDEEYKNQSPSVMATYAAIDYATDNNLPLFDFMGAGKPDEDYGVRDFKSKFGGALVNHGRFLKVHNPLLFKAGKFGLKVMQKIKQ